MLNLEVTARTELRSDMQDSQSHSSDRQYAAYSFKIFISTVAHFLSFEAFSRMEIWRERKQTDTVESMQGAFMMGFVMVQQCPLMFVIFLKPWI